MTKKGLLLLITIKKCMKMVVCIVSLTGNIKFNLLQTSCEMFPRYYHIYVSVYMSLIMMYK